MKNDIQRHYGKLTDQDLVELLPAIIKAIEQLAPSNEMFGEGIVAQCFSSGACGSLRVLTSLVAGNRESGNPRSGNPQASSTTPPARSSPW